MNDSAAPQHGKGRIVKSRFPAGKPKCVAIHRETGLYLHLSGAGTTPSRHDAWVGHPEQFRNLKAVSPDAENFKIRRSE